MFSDHIHTDIFQDLEVVHHRPVSRGSIQSIRPVSLTISLAVMKQGKKEDLLECTERKEYLSIEKVSGDTINSAFLDSPKASVCPHGIVPEGDGQIVKYRRTR